jgi:hypothetical protein
MSFGKIVIAGVEHDLTHLDPLMIRVTAKTTGSPTYNVHVSFGRHCFARELRHGDPVSHHVPDNGGSVRCFCPIRTTHSRHLSKIVRAAPTGPAFFSQGKNMLLVDWVPGVVGPYAVFFNLQPSTLKNIDVAMFVASAYEKPNLVKAMPAIAFTTLVGKVSNGHVPFKPKRLTKW